MRGLLQTIPVSAHTLRTTTAPSDAPIPVVAPAASGTGKTSYATVALSIRQQGFGAARTRLTSTREGGARSSRGKTTSTDTFGPCTVERSSCDISSIPIHVPSIAPDDRCAPLRSQAIRSAVLSQTLVKAPLDAVLRGVACFVTIRTPIDLCAGRTLALVAITTVQVTCLAGRANCNARNLGRGLALLWWDRRYTA